MKFPGKGVWLAILLVFSPGMAFAIFELFLVDLPVKPNTKLAGWAALVVGAMCIVGLAVTLVREAVQRRKRRANR